MDTTGYQKLGKRTLYYKLFQKGIVAILFFALLIVLLFVRIGENSSGASLDAMSYTNIALLIVLALFVLAFIFDFVGSYVSYVRLQYKLDQNGISIRTGILGKEETSVPFRQIQDIDIEQTLTARMCGVCNFVILTAGHEDRSSTGDESEITLPSLSVSQAQELKITLLSKSNIQQVAQMPGQVQQ